VLPTICFFLVLFTGFAFKPLVALAVLPAVSALVAFVVGRAVALSLPWAIVIALGSGAFCFIADGGALLLHGLMRFFHDF